MINVRFIPIDRWPKPPTLNRRVATFRVSYQDTLQLLEYELDKIDARQVTIQAYFHADDIRNDGWPRLSAIPTAPGVILSFGVLKAWDPVTRRRDLTELSFPCDTFTTFDDNLRAITLTLEALRKIDRYGVTPGHEQYRGWARLGSGSGEGNGASSSDNSSDGMTRAEAEMFLVTHGGSSDFAVAYRRAASRLHPDNQVTGNHEAFVRLQKAKAVLEQLGVL